jgi:hypothetical protein
MVMTRHFAVGGDAKTPKGEKLGYKTAILYLAPSDASGVGDTCPKAGLCKDFCLGLYAGRVTFMPNIVKARIEKTRRYFLETETFINELSAEVSRLKRKVERNGYKLCVRLNGSSDLPQLSRLLAVRHPDVQFYDYTKIPRPWTRTLPNYHLTFSRDSIQNETECLEALQHGINVAVVFHGEMPKTWRGYPVVNGDETDLRFLDPTGVVVGLKPKGKLRKAQTDFVVLT